MYLQRVLPECAAWDKMARIALPLSALLIACRLHD